MTPTPPAPVPTPTPTPKPIPKVILIPKVPKVIPIPKVPKIISKPELKMEPKAPTLAPEATSTPATEDHHEHTESTIPAKTILPIPVSYGQGLFSPYGPGASYGPQSYYPRPYGYPSRRMMRPQIMVTRQPSAPINWAVPAAVGSATLLYLLMA